MELSQLKYFKVIADYQNISKAAKRLFMTQPALSRSIRQLEDYYGVKLFDRYGKSIVLNDCGRILLRYANQIIDSVNNLESELAEFNINTDAAVSLSINISTNLLMDMLPGFREEQPEICINFVQNDFSLPDEDNYDICINSSIEELRLLNTITVLKERILLALPKSHPLTNKESIDFNEIVMEPFIQLKGKDFIALTETCYRETGFMPKTILQCDMPGPLLEFVALGFGFSLMPEVTWSGSQKIVFRPITGFDFTRYISISWRGKTYMSRNAEIFRDYLIGYFRNLNNN